MASHREHPSLKMAAILHADVAGSTTLVQLNESVAHERINQAFNHFSSVIRQYGGTVHEVRGDALVAEFSRASNAVCSALEFQRRHAQELAALSDEIIPRVRVGVSLGEVVLADGTVTGAGVVLAQRVEQFAEPGGLCITGAIHEALPQRMPVEQENLGERQVKGFKETVRVYAVALREGGELPKPADTRKRPPARKRPHAALAAAVLVAGAAGLLAWVKPWAPENAPQQTVDRSASRPDQTAPAATEVGLSRSHDGKPSIAVLPFTNMSGDPQQEYFADGITEDLTTDLSKISGLFVVARNSSFAYKGKSPDVRDVSRELGVRYVLEGSVRRVGDQIRINAQLIDATTGGHVWADRFDGTMADVFSLQDSVNDEIVDALEVNLTIDDRRRLDKIETSNPEAYDMLLRGFERYQQFSREANEESRELFLEAIRLDPDYARAYANVALTYGTAVNFDWTDEPDDEIRLGLEYAERALELDDSIPQIYLTRSMLYLAQDRHDAAVEAGRRTIEVHPNYADGHAALAFVQSYAGQLEESLEAIREAKRINPQYSYIYLALEGRILFLLKRYEEALVPLEQSVARNPVFELGKLHLAATYAELGRIDDASWAVEEAMVIRPDISLANLRDNSNYKRPEDMDHYLNALRKAGMAEE